MVGASLLFIKSPQETTPEFLMGGGAVSEVAAGPELVAQLSRGGGTFSPTPNLGRGAGDLISHDQVMTAQ